VSVVWVTRETELARPRGDTGACRRSAQLGSAKGPTAAIRRLQRARGNQAVARLVAGAPAARRAAVPRAGTAMLARGTYVDVQATKSGYGLAVNKRPTNQRSALDEIIDDVWKKYPAVSDAERLLYQHAKGNASDAKLLVGNKWLSDNQAAVCHKLAINTFMRHLAIWAEDLFNDVLGAPAVGDAVMDRMVAEMTAGTAKYGPNARIAWAALKAFRLTPKGPSHALAIVGQVDTLCNTLIAEMNRSPANLYIGSQPTNSSIQDHFDPHISTDPADPNAAPGTPRTSAIHGAEHAFAAAYNMPPSSPIRMMDAGVHGYATSSITAQPGMQGWNFPPASVGGHGV
jgi:hypothetical protein